jgi:hypothetical protein
MYNVDGRQPEHETSPPPHETALIYALARSNDAGRFAVEAGR